MMRSIRMPNAAKWVCLISLGLGMAACDGSRADKPEAPASQPAVSESAGSDDALPAAQDRPENKSIIRSDIEQAPVDTPVLEPQTLIVPFPERGAKPDDAGFALIDGLITSPVFRAGGPISIWGHSDSAGSDTTNMAASRRRAEAVNAYMLSKGVARDRITVIPMGEDRPIAPNRKLDGSDDIEGRRKNRRVEIRVDLPAPPAEAEAATKGSQSPK